MNEKEESGTTLGFEFSKAQELYQKIENSSLSSSDPSYQVFLLLYLLYFFVLYSKHYFI